MFLLDKCGVGSYFGSSWSSIKVVALLTDWFLTSRDFQLVASGFLSRINCSTKCFPLLFSILKKSSKISSFLFYSSSNFWQRMYFVLTNVSRSKNLESSSVFHKIYPWSLFMGNWFTKTAKYDLVGDGFPYSLGLLKISSTMLISCYGSASVV